MVKMNRRTLKLKPKPVTQAQWGDWVIADRTDPLTDEHLYEFANKAGVDIAEVRAVADEVRKDLIVLNRVYQVYIRKLGSTMVHLSIKRRDKQPLGPERFRDLQRIKSDLVGPECEAVEIYPAESRLVDTSNQYHLWVFSDPTYRLPFGFDSKRFILETSVGNAVQQPFER